MQLLYLSSRLTGKRKKVCHAGQYSPVIPEVFLAYESLLPTAGVRKERDGR